MVLSSWLIDRLEEMKDEQILLVQDPLRLLPETDGAVHRFANENDFTVIIASTNLVFRELYEKATAAKDTNKLLVIDRAPVRRRTHASMTKAPPPFYPDLLARTKKTARIVISLRQFLIEKTGDPNWPQEVDDPRFAKVIIGSIEAVLQAHAGLRVVHSTRFTDHDFKTIVAYSALGVPEAAFKRPEAETYWRIALMGYPVLEELDSLVPEIAHSIREQLHSAPAPFCWFADSPPELVVRAFYLATILSQHFEHWKLLLTNIDPELRAFSEMEPSLISEAASKLVSLDRDRANRDLLEVEKSLSKETLAFILLDQLKLISGGRFAEVIEREHYSVLIRSLALLVALDNLLSPTPTLGAHEKIEKVLFTEEDGKKDRFIEERPSSAWENLKTAYQLTGSILEIQKNLDDAVKILRVKPTTELTFEWFRILWNDRRVNRLEYYLSALERLAHSGDFLPRPENELPSAFLAARNRIRERISLLNDRIQEALLLLNTRYQELVAKQYKSWANSDSSNVWLTSQFLRRCLKPNWDPEREKAVVFVFDGMRYDIWEELVRPVFEERMEFIEDYPALSLLPSETHISRKAIFAGTFPDSFDTRRGEDVLLKEAMQREFGYTGDVEVITPDGAGTGEIVRYRADNIDFFIFELCDKELHKIRLKTLPDGRRVPDRPLAFIYQQHIKDIIDTEVMAIIRNLPPDTKVFVVADHGFGAVGRERLWLESSWLNEPGDCFYLNAWLKQNLCDVGAPQKVRENVIEFSVTDLRMPNTEEVYDRVTKQTRKKRFKSIIFPKTGFALSRPHAHFNPDAFSHGGISIQEMLIPMLVMRVKMPDDGLLELGQIAGPTELIEGEEAEFRMPIRLIDSYRHRGLRIDVQAVYHNRESTRTLPSIVQYVSASWDDIVFRFVPDASDASNEERRIGSMERTLTISVSYREGQRIVRKTRSIRFSLRLDSEKIIRRVPAHLGKILGLMPKGMR